MAGRIRRKTARASVFLSYRHDEGYLKDLVRAELRANNWTVETDDRLRTSVYARGELHRDLSKLLNSCLFVMPIITRSWLASQETRDELVRAHERRKLIIPLVDDELVLKSGLLDELPFFIRESPWERFNRNNIGEQAVNALRNRGDLALACKRDEMLDYLRLMGDTITSPNFDPRPMQVRHAKSVLARSEELVRKVWVHPSYLEFQTPVSHHEAYLSVAAPYFEGAESIDAVSVSRISTFWVSDPRASATERYRQAHKGGTKVRRLFVFRHTEELAAHARELDRHFSMYGTGNRGVVLVTSERYYRSILENWPDSKPLYPRVHSIEEDFGVLRTGSDAYIATLDGNAYRIDSVRRGGPREIFHDQFGKFLDDSVAGLHREVVKWGRKSSDASNLADISETLFPTQPGPVLHLVLLDLDGSLADTEDDAPAQRLTAEQRLAARSAVGNVVDGIAQKLRPKAGELGIREFRVLDNVPPLGHSDGKFLGRIAIDARFDYAFAVTFDDVASLKGYYGDPLHSEAREELYLALNPAIRTLYEKAKAVTDDKKNPFGVAEVFERIESEMQRWILRIDLHEDLSACRVMSRLSWPASL